MNGQLARARRDQPRKPKRKPSLESPLSQMTLPGAAPLPAWQHVVMTARLPAERDAWPVLPWPDHVRRWLEHAKTPEFKARVARAVDVARAGAEKGRLFASLSGGKDSSALAGVLAEAGVSVPGVYARSTFDYPGTSETIDALGRAVGMTVYVLEPAEIGRHVERICKKYGTPKPRKRRGMADYDEWDLIRCFPPDVVLLDERPMADLVKAIGHANLLTDYTYKAGYDGSFHGVRAQESLGRHINYKTKGAVYRSSVDGKWSVTPIAHWSGKDVMAYVHSRGLPLHEYYEKAYATGLSRPDPARIRTGALPYSDIAEKGVLVPVARVYPDYWRRLTAARPEIERFALVERIQR